MSHLIRSLTVLILVLLTGISSRAHASKKAVQSDHLKSYWLYLRDDGKTWCAFSSEASFKSNPAATNSSEVVEVRYSSNTPVEILDQIQPESGDWVVIDQYCLRKNLVKRDNLLDQPKLEIRQEATIHGEHVDPFHLVSVTTLPAGKRTKASPDLDFPQVPVSAHPITKPFMKVIQKMRSQSLSTLCTKP